LKRVAVLFSGAGSNLKYILDNIHQKEIEVVVAITNNPNAGGIIFANEYNIPLYIIDSKLFKDREEFDAKIVKKLEEYNPDLTVLAGFMRILTPIFTDNIKAINLHPSLLPKHKGIKAIERSYEDSSQFGGVTLHWVTSELDGGEIILQKEVDKSNLSFKEYESRVKTIEKIALVEGILDTIKDWR